MDSRPHLLSSPNIPKPIHGLNPRTIMGKTAWDVKRQEVYASTQYHCAACGVHKSSARKHKWLEAHEIFSIAYKRGVADLIEIVPLCHFCHSFIHSGLLRIKARNKDVTAQHVRDVLEHGCDVLRSGGNAMFSGTAVLCDLVSVNRGGIKTMTPPSDIADWGKWVMTWDGKEYRGEFKSFKQWQRAYSR